MRCSRWAGSTGGACSGATTTRVATRLASGSCGQLTAAATDEPIRASVCHCLACQRRTGSAFAAQARFARKQVVPAKRSSTCVRVGDEGGRVSFHFCPDCGATVHHQLSGNDDFLAIPLGAFADPGFPAPTFSVCENRQPAWLHLSGDIARLA